MKNILSNFLIRLKNNPRQELFQIVKNSRSEQLSYELLANGGYRYANLLSAKGACPGDVVLIALPLESDLFFAVLGALFVGCIPAMMPLPSAKQDPVLFWSSHDQLFHHMCGGFFVTSDENVEQVTANIAPDLLTMSDFTSISGVTPEEFAQLPN